MAFTGFKFHTNIRKPRQLQIFASFPLHPHSFVLPIVMFLLTLLLLALPVVYAQNWVSGTGRLNSGSDQAVSFSSEAYSSTVKSIVSSIEQGPNRTTSTSLPVDKIYGVNVSAHPPCNYRVTSWWDRSAIGSCLNHGKISAVSRLEGD